MDIIVPNVYRKFSSGVSNPQLQRSLLKDAALTDRIRINAYALAGRTVVADVGRWMRENHWTGSPKCVFEAGDRGAGDLKSWLRHDGHLTPEFEGKDTAPLQAADWLAYESFQAIKNQAAIRAGAPQRWAFAQFDRRVIGDLRFYSPQNLLTLESNLENHASLLRYEFPSASEQLDSIE